MSPGGQFRMSLDTDDRCHRILIVATNSANGRFQSTPVSWQENRDRQVWVDLGRCRSNVYQDIRIHRCDGTPRVWCNAVFQRESVRRAPEPLVPQKLGMRARIAADCSRAHRAAFGAGNDHNLRLIVAEPRARR